MYHDEIHALVADAYRALDSADGAGVVCYTDQRLASLPAGAPRQWAVGVDNPIV